MEGGYVLSEGIFYNKGCHAYRLYSGICYAGSQIVGYVCWRMCTTEKLIIVVKRFHFKVKTELVKIKVYLRRKVKQKKWFKDLANKIREEFGERGTWKTSEEGFVWTHSQHGGKVQFLMQYDGYADFVKIWHPSRKWFEQARAIGDFTQWIYNNASEYVRKIEIPI